MKPEEAIRHYKVLHEDYKSNMGDYYKEMFDKMGEEVVALLEKQVAKKPIPGSSYLHKCPVCNFRLTIYKENYCDECGQKLDWRGNERL